MQRNHKTISTVESRFYFSWASKGASNMFVWTKALSFKLALANIAGRETC